MMMQIFRFLCVALLLITGLAHAQEQHISQIKAGLNAIVELGEKERKQHQALLEELMEQAEALLQAHPQEPSALVWHAVVYEQYANFRGGFTGVKLAKQARENLEDAIAQAPEGEQGLAYLTLGMLYERTPGWPVAFGSIKNADEMYAKAVEIRPQGVDTNYQYARFLKGIERKEEAFQYAQKALEATPRPTLEAFDKAQQQLALKLVGAKQSASAK